MPGKKLPPEAESPNWYAVKETAKEMWNAKDFVPAKQKLLKKIREAGPAEEPFKSPNWDATKQLAAEFADAILPNNPTQAAAGMLGAGLLGKAVKARRASKAATKAQHEDWMRKLGKAEWEPDYLQNEDEFSRLFLGD